MNPSILRKSIVLSGLLVLLGMGCDSPTTETSPPASPLLSGVDEMPPQAPDFKGRTPVGAGASLGMDGEEITFELRDRQLPGAARVLSAGRGITRPEPGRSEVPYWVDTEEEARAAVREQAEREVDLVKIWVDDRGGQYETLDAEFYGPIIDEVHSFLVHRNRVRTLEATADFFNRMLRGDDRGTRRRAIHTRFVMAIHRPPPPLAWSPGGRDS